MGKRSAGTMVKTRNKFQGVGNILLFNWHFYLLACIFIVSSLLLSSYYFPAYLKLIFILNGLIVFQLLVSLFTSYFIYDLNSLYDFKLIKASTKKMFLANINAGFDETSEILKQKFSQSTLIPMDFYNPENHTEISIKRARKRYPPTDENLQISATNINYTDHSFDKIFLIFTAHEIRDFKERLKFFEELKRILKPDGEIILIEHLRDMPNFLAYFVGFFPFLQQKIVDKNNFIC
jgi:SAM-dependent methyltransferase